MKCCSSSLLIFIKYALAGAIVISTELAAQPTAPNAPSSVTASTAEVISTTKFGAKADGITDDTESLQEALTYCSNNAAICQIPSGGKHLVKKSLFFWGDATLTAQPGGSILFDVANEKYLFNLGISGKRSLINPLWNIRKTFTGTISDVDFVVLNSKAPAGRIIQFWRSNGATLDSNTFEPKKFWYSATGAGNDEQWLIDGPQHYVRENVTIVNNTMRALQTGDGGEGISLGSFDTVFISNNFVTGVGDDPIAIHYSRNVKILNNTLESIDGRIFISNSKDVEIANNKHTRIASPVDGKFYPGIALIYVGFEQFEIPAWNKSPYAAPENITVHNNQLFYPKSAVDGNGAAIYVYAPRNVTIENNVITNDSVSRNPLYGVYVLPAEVTGWKDPTGIDTALSMSGKPVARVHNALINHNENRGEHPLPLVMTGNCVDYVGNLRVTNNFGHNRFGIYCLGSGVNASNNNPSK